MPSVNVELRAFNAKYSQSRFLCRMSRSLVLVIVQFACIAFFIVTGPIWAHSMLGLLIEIGGIALGLWAIITMKWEKLSVFPEPRKDGKLLKSGPYQLIRHPMYTAVLLVCGTLAVDRFEEAGLAVFVVLLFNQLMKLRHEERLLIKHYGEDYYAYMANSYALIPYVF